MIIKYPTGLYRTVLPQEPSDSASVTYTISNNQPPRTDLVFPRLPESLEGRKRQPVEAPLDVRRKQLGLLALTTSGSRRQEAGTNAKQFDIGQILEFEQTTTQAVQPMLVSEFTEIRHDTNLFDYTGLGISEAEQEVMSAASLKAHVALTNRLNELKQARADAEVIISNQQKTINEANKTISALEVVVSTSPDVDIVALITKLKTKLAAATALRDEAIADANAYADEAESVVAELRTVATVVK